MRLPFIAGFTVVRQLPAPSGSANLQRLAVLPDSFQVFLLPANSPALGLA